MAVEVTKGPTLPARLPDPSPGSGGQETETNRNKTLVANLIFFPLTAGNCLSYKLESCKNDESARTMNCRELFLARDLSLQLQHGAIFSNVSQTSE